MIHDFATAPRKSDWRIADNEARGRDQACRSVDGRSAERREGRAQGGPERKINRSVADLKAVRTSRRADASESVAPQNVSRGKVRNKARFVWPLVALCSFVLTWKWVLSEGDIVSDQQPDAAAKKEYEESMLLSEESLIDKPKAMLDVAGVFSGVESAATRSQILVDVSSPAPGESEVAKQSGKSGVSITLNEGAAVSEGPVAIELVSDVEVDPDYEFYDSLKQGSWPVPINRGAYVDGELAERERPVYNLQAASFRSRDDADRLVSRLKIHRLKASVQPSVSSNGQYWYQVSVGPFISTTNLNKAQDVLVSMNMMPLKKRVQ